MSGERQINLRGNQIKSHCPCKPSLLLLVLFPIPTHVPGRGPFDIGKIRFREKGGRLAIGRWITLLTDKRRACCHLKFANIVGSPCLRK